MSQMDSDNFVPVWAVACMEDIKALTADVDLIVDVLRGNCAAALLFCGAQCSVVADSEVYTDSWTHHYKHKNTYFFFKCQLFKHLFLSFRHFYVKAF